MKTKEEVQDLLNEIKELMLKNDLKHFIVNKPESSEIDDDVPAIADYGTDEEDGAMAVIMDSDIYYDCYGCDYACAIACWEEAYYNRYYIIEGILLTNDELRFIITEDHENEDGADFVHTFMCSEYDLFNGVWQNCSSEDYDIERALRVYAELLNAYPDLD